MLAYKYSPDEMGVSAQTHRICIGLFDCHVSVGVSSTSEWLQMQMLLVFARTVLVMFIPVLYFYMLLYLMSITSVLASMSQPILNENKELRLNKKTGRYFASCQYSLGGYYSIYCLTIFLPSILKILQKMRTKSSHKKTNSVFF